MTKIEGKQVELHSSSTSSECSPSDTRQCRSPPDLQVSLLHSIFISLLVCVCVNSHCSSYFVLFLLAVQNQLRNIHAALEEENQLRPDER